VYLSHGEGSPVWVVDGNEYGAGDALLAVPHAPRHLHEPGVDEQWTLSVAHRADDLERYVDAFEAFARDVSP
jgi:glutamate-1-semialdehyde aminotransferase